MRMVLYLSALLMLGIAIDLYVNPDDNKDIANKAKSITNKIEGFAQQKIVINGGIINE